MAEIDPATRIYQAPGVYTTPDNQQVHILYGGQGWRPRWPRTRALHLGPVLGSLSSGAR